MDETADIPSSRSNNPRAPVVKERHKLWLKRWHVAVGVTVLVTALTTLTVYSILAAREAELRHARQMTDNLARALEELTARAIGESNLLLADAVRAIEAAPLPDRAAAAERAFAELQSKSANIAAWLLFDAEGVAVASSLPYPVDAVAERRFFTVHRDGESRKPFVGEMVASPRTGRPFLAASRRVSLPDGGFAGIVLAAIDPATFAAFYDSLDVGPNGARAAITEDGAIVARVPGHENFAGRTIPRASFPAGFFDAPSGRGEGRWQDDGVDRLSSFRRVPGTPLIVSVGIARSDTLAAWAPHAAAVAVVGLGVLGLLVAAAALWLRDFARQRVIDDLVREQRHAEELAASERRLRSILDTVIDGVITMDEHGTIETFNPAAERIFGYAAEEVVGCSIARLLAEPYAVEPARHLAAAKSRRPDGAGREVEGRRKDGSLFPLDLGIGALVLPGADGAPAERVLIATIRDISAQKELARQLRQAQKMEALGQLTGGIAHDFNNLLMVAILNLELLAERVEGRDNETLVQPALQSALMSAELTQRLLAFARRQPLKPERVEVGRLVAGMKVMLRRSLGERVRVETRVQPHLWPCRVDPAQLENALVNLAINARDAMPTGGTILIEASNFAVPPGRATGLDEIPPGEYVLVAVADDGIGMTEEVRRRAVEPFFTTKEVGKGSGLGLSQVYGFVRQSNGHFAIDSEPGSGTFVRMYFPRSSAAEPATARDAARAS